MNRKGRRGDLVGKVAKIAGVATVGIGSIVGLEGCGAGMYATGINNNNPALAGAGALVASYEAAAIEAGVWGRDNGSTANVGGETLDNGKGIPKGLVLRCMNRYNELLRIEQKRELTPEEKFNRLSCINTIDDYDPNWVERRNESFKLLSSKSE